MTEFDEFVGIDVGKEMLVVHILGTGETTTWGNDANGIAALCARLAIAGTRARIVFEATGGYEAALWEALDGWKAKGAPFVAGQISARNALNFARARGQLYKTDRVDARRLAEYARHFPHEGRAHPGAGCARLSALVMRRAALVETRKAAMTRQKQSRLPELACLEARIIAFVTREIAKLEAAIQATIAADEAFSAKARLLRSIPGVGSVLTALLLARMPELGTISDKQAAALVGVAPMANDSGKRQGYRQIRGGRREIRCVLFQAALSASQCNSAIQPFARRLKAAGKAHKQVMTAVARKLIVIANCVLARGYPWQEHAPA